MTIASRLLQIARPYWEGDARRFAWTAIAGVVGLMLIDTQLSVWLNRQAGELTSALAAHDADRFWHAVHRTLMLLAVAVPAYAAYYWSRDAFANRWREWMTRQYLDRYLSDRAYYRLGLEPDLDNPDQRIAEDINNFTGRSLNFVFIFIGSVMQLLAFSVVLWSISTRLVAVLAAYAVIGTALSMWLFGRPLIRLNAWQLRREADLRFDLIRVRENAESIAFYRGEAPERARLLKRLRGVVGNYRRMIRTQRNLNVFQRAFSQLSLLIPTVLLAAEVLSGRMEVGRAIEAGGAFAAVLGAVSLIVDNFESLSRFAAGIDRLHVLRAHLFGERSSVAEQVLRGESGEGSLAIESLSVRAPASERMLVERLDLQLKAGESLLITGTSGSGKSSLLRAIAGLWTDGSGQVMHPPDRDVFFLPQKPYLQPGTLRSQLVYPATQSELSDERLLEILQEVQLPDLAQRVGGLDAVQDWGKLLSGGEQQRMAFARLLVHAPRMAILDEATSALDDANEKRLYQRLRDRGITLVSIAHRAAVRRFHRRVLKLEGNGRWKVEDVAQESRGGP